MNICSSLPLKMMIHFPYGLHCLMRSIPALSGLRPRTSAFAACPRTRTVSIHLPISRVSLGIFKALWRRLACKRKSYQRLPAYCPFQPENYAFCPKKIFRCPKWTMYKRKANNRPANCCSLANRHSAGIQRNMIRTNRGRGWNQTPGRQYRTSLVGALLGSPAIYYPSRRNRR